MSGSLWGPVPVPTHAPFSHGTGPDRHRRLQGGLAGPSFGTA
ncbi:MAG TPA: hypothetical protein VN520_36245 [Streptomyces sp.]|nr:hypothetical protein [Streptomyces sp.]HWU11744.1 hypothetical protein [Streptomyces sp.]